ncbi:hypothetical protein, partial [Rosenbergiella collisarenosi]|uniref:hypothetical protein n=1 Tax=Rosenbergiella collisarenosi TaxID=1544695 RepID=UPI001F4DBF6D
NMRTIIFVILYGKEIKESSTLDSIISCESLVETDSLIIVNNGPFPIQENLDVFDSQCGRVYLDNSSLNIPLSKLYNSLIRNNEGFDRYIIFDDDTCIPPEFFSTLNLDYHSQVDLQLPKVISIDDNVLYYPIVNGNVIDSEDKSLIFSNNDIVYSIGSGLIIYKSCIEKFYSHSYDLFDESFALYGVDMSIFKRIEKLKSVYN